MQRVIVKPLVAAPLFCAVFLIAPGCASVDPRADFDQASRHVEEAVGQPWIYRPDDDAAAQERVARLLEGGVTADDAMEIALLNNPRLQARLFDIGIGRSEVVQAGLFSNPGFSLELRFPDGGGLADLQLGLAQNIAELWQIPIRQRAAERDLDRIILEAARDATTTAQDAQAAYFRAVGGDRERELARENLAITQQLVDLTVARRDAGSGSEVDVNLTRSQHMNSELQARSVELVAVEARAELVKLLGLETAPDQVELAEALSEPAPVEIAAETLIGLAREHRLDFRALGRAVEAAEARVDLEKTRFLQAIELGVSAERSERPPSAGRDWLADTAWASAQAGQLAAPSLQPEAETTSDWVVGPTLGVEIPLFDQNQAQIAKAELQYQQAAQILKALDRELIQDAHAALERSRTATDNARFYRDSVLPLREQGLRLTQEAYRAGQLALPSVLEAQRNLLAARSDYVKTLLSAAMALIDLERVAGQPVRNLRGQPVQNESGAQANEPSQEDGR